MHRTTPAVAALLIAVSTTLWTLLELILVREISVGVEHMAALIAVIWGIGYVAGFRTGSKLTSNEYHWRTPFLLLLLVGFLLYVLSLQRFSSLMYFSYLVYFLASFQVGLIVSSTTTITINLTDSESWPHAVFILRGVSSIIYAFLAFILSYGILQEKISYTHGARIIIIILMLSSIASFFTVRRPAIRESVLKNLDRLADALAFGETRIRMSDRQLLLLSYFTAIVGMLRIISLQESGLELNPLTISVYGLFYSIGVGIGLVFYSPLLIVLVVFGSFLLSFITEGFVELSLLLVSAGIAEASLMMIILEAEPTRLNRVMSFITINMALMGLFVIVINHFFGIEYKIVILASFLITPLLIRNKPSWY